MKQLFRICAGLILALALSLPAFAGEMPTPPAGPQESPGITGPQESPGVAGEIPTPGVTGEIPTGGFTGEISAPGVAGDMGFPELLFALFSLF